MNKIAEVLNSLNVKGIESKLLEKKQVDCPVTHRFGPGVYIRELFMPKNTFAIGHHQNFEHLNIFLKGEVTVLNDDGSSSNLKAPMIFVGKPGRKIGFVKDDVVWLNVYATNETDIEKLEDKYLTKSDEWLAHNSEKVSVDKFKCKIDRDDFYEALTEIGISSEVVSSQSKCASDIAELPLGDYKFKIGASPIEGKGIFATSLIKDGEVVGPARIGSRRTYLGRYTNHSIKPNSVMKQTGNGDVLLIASSNILGCLGGQDGEEITVDYRETYKLALKINKGNLCQG